MQFCKHYCSSCITRVTKAFAKLKKLRYSLQDFAHVVRRKFEAAVPPAAKTSKCNCFFLGNGKARPLISSIEIAHLLENAEFTF